MNVKLTHKITVAFFAAVLLFPLLVEATHALKTHEHLVCTSKYEKHFHEDDIDCSSYHFISKHLSFSLSNDYEIKTFENYALPILEKGNIAYTSYFKHNSSRAPPYCIV